MVGVIQRHDNDWKNHGCHEWSIPCRLCLVVFGVANRLFPIRDGNDVRVGFLEGRDAAYRTRTTRDTVWHLLGRHCFGRIIYNAANVLGNLGGTPAAQGYGHWIQDKKRIKIDSCYNLNPTPSSGAHLGSRYDRMPKSNFKAYGHFTGDVLSSILCFQWFLWLLRHFAQVHIPKQCNHVGKQHLEFGGHHREIDAGCRYPQGPICSKQIRRQFDNLFSNIFSTFQMIECEHKTRLKENLESKLVEHYLLYHSLQVPWAREQTSVQSAEPKMQKRTCITTAHDEKVEGSTPIIVGIYEKNILRKNIPGTRDYATRECFRFEGMCFQFLHIPANYRRSIRTGKPL